MSCDQRRKSSMTARLIFGLGYLSVHSLFVHPAHATDEYSTNLYGALGLNTVPSARMDPAGTIRAQISHLDPYAHGTLGVQIAKPLSLVLRQSAEISSWKEDAKDLYPGLDFKLRLLEETRALPELSVGLQSAFGHKRTAAEYIAASKRYKDFDFTGGIGWGALGQSGDFSNPLKLLGDSFNENRPNDGALPNRPGDWFSGDETAFFGGIEYFTPIDGLSLKADYTSFRYDAERAAGDYHAPPPWSIGVNYKPTPWIDLGLAAQGRDKIIARLSLQGLLQNWRKQDAQTKTKTPLRPYRTELALPAQMENSAARDNMYLFDAQREGASAQATLLLKDQLSAPKQIGQAVIHMANHAGKHTEQIEIKPMILGLQGPKVKLMRRDLEQALAKDQGSAEEIWQHTEFDSEYKTKGALEIKRPQKYGYGINDFGLTLDNQLSLSEEDSGVLYRTALIISHKIPKFYGLLDNFAALRLNLKENLSGLSSVRPAPYYSVRGDVEAFAQRSISLERLFTAYTHSPRPDLHLKLIGGYLEEMYAGAGGEILYRPFDSRFTIGAEGWLALKRDPYTVMNTGLRGDRQITGHINGWYELPYWDTALHASFGRYLGGDVGTTIGLNKNFENGVKLESYLTLTNKDDLDLFGGTTNTASGVRLSLPLGGFRYAPQNANIKLRAESLGRQTGQKLDAPLPLYDLTEPFTLKHMQDHWSGVTN